jgi:UDP-perosamine 4-acetyltransferase
MYSLVILGGGGHAKVVVDVLRSAGSFKPIGYTAREPGPPLAGDVPYLGTDQYLPTLRDKVPHAFVAIGNNATRLAIGKMLAAQGFRLPPALSAQAVISPSARIGRGAVIMPGAIVNADATVGDFVIVNTGASIDHDCVIGPGAHIAPGTSVCGSVVVGELAFVGVGASIIRGVNVGPRAIVGAGAAVVRDVPSDVTVVGVPARPI